MRVFAALFALSLSTTATAQLIALGEDIADPHRALAEAQAQARSASSRAEGLEADAARAGAAADRTAQAAAAAAARIQQAEAEVAADEAQISLIDRQRTQLRASLAERQRPLVRLTAALQRLSRRPLAIALLRPGSVRDAMHSRALIETMIPEVRRRTAGLRAEIARGQALQAQARGAQRSLRAEAHNLTARRAQLAALETQQRLSVRDVSGSADREAERALALAEAARDLGGLVDVLGKAGALREQLAALPGPVLRTEHPGADAESAPPPSPDTAASTSPGPYLLPVAGRLVVGFGNAAQGTASRGISIAARAGAQVIAPGAGRVAFAGAYRGYGQIVIIAHAGGWISLITGLAQSDVQVGDRLVAGAPLGVASSGHTPLGLELRRAGVPVNPLDYIR